MELTKQVTSLELSKRLKELGVKQESLFWWLNPFKEQGFILTQDSEWDKNDHHEFCSAFTVAELGEMLNVSGFGDMTTSCLGANGWHCSGNTTKLGRKHFIDTTEAGARAKMLIYLLENNLITLKDKIEENI